MTLAKRFIPTNEESTKKSDDAPRTAGRVGNATMWTWRGPRRKRFIVVVVVIWLLYVFIKHVPTDLPPVSSRFDPRYGALRPTLSSSQEDISSGPQSTKKEYHFEGPIKFYNLTSSLYRAIALRDNGRNVLFAISNVKGMSNVLPLACEMSTHKRNKVHVALFGRQEVNIDTIKEVHGIDDIDCAVYWHDARPDFAGISSNERMETSNRAALSYLLTHLRPQAVVMNSFSREDDFFVEPVQDITRLAGVALIPLPGNSIDDLRWLSQLDTASLRYWNKIQIEILVHGSTTSSGSLIRLLQSIERADYFGMALPKLIIELPAVADPPTMDYLTTFRWPPSSAEADSKVSIRRRIVTKHMTAAEASLRTVEAFYPARAETSHLLLLAPTAELSRSYFHYLMLTLLEYKYSSTAMSSAANLTGISLEEYPHHLDRSNTVEARAAAGTSDPFILWQAPNSNAALYFGDKWVEFHSFLSQRVTVGPELAVSEGSAKLVSPQNPAWLGHMLDMIRARGYAMLYPSTREGMMPLVTIHNELYHLPEEFSTTGASSSDERDEELSAGLTPGEVLTADSERQISQKDEVAVTTTENILSLLSLGSARNASSTLPQLHSLQLLSVDGQELTWNSSIQLSTAFADQFSLDFGGCKSLADRAVVRTRSADDLFCLADWVPFN